MKKLAAALLILTAGCATAPPRVDPFAEMTPGGAAPASYPNLSLAIVFSQNTRNTIAYADKATKDVTLVSMDLHKPLEALVAQLRGNFKSVVKVETLEEAKGAGTDLIALVDFYEAATGFNKDIEVDETVHFMDRAGVALDRISARDKKNTWQTAHLSLTPLPITLAAVQETVRQRFQEALTASEPIKRLAHERSGSVASPAPAAAGKPGASDVDRPGYQIPEDPGRFALVIGIESYQTLPPADYAERDAAAVRRHLLALGYPERNIIFLTGANAGKSGIEKYVESWLPRNIDEKSRVFVYFSGHGAPDVKTGQAYLMPWDGDAKFLDATGYPVERLYRSLGALKAKRVVVALDSCFSGAGGRSVIAKGARPLVSRVDQGMPSSDKLVVLAAASGDEITGAAENQGHGLFTYYLLKGLNEKAGEASVEALFDSLKPRVQTAARRDNRDQTPQLLAPAAPAFGL